MARGKLKKVTGKIITSSKKNMIQQESIIPELANESLASDEGLFGVPSRLYSNGLTPGSSNFATMRYRFNNIWRGIMPFQAQDNFISIRDAVWLCQKAYFNVAIFRNAINTMVELCNTDVYLEGGNQQSQDFFRAWFKRVNLWKLKDMFFRELFRSGNVFLFRLDGTINKSDALKLNQSYAAINDLELPLRYILLNVADMAALNNITYDSPVYYKILTPQQIQILKKSTNPDDKEVYKNLTKVMKSYFDGETGSPIPIDVSKLHTIFYQKQDYEPFAVPMGFAVLDDINLKLEFKRTDAILARTVEYITLLITTGSETKPDGTGGVSQKAIGALKEIFSREEIGRVLVSDYTTKMDWSIPDISKVFGPEKYATVNEDISAGLMDIFFGQQRFANVVAKLKVFIEKINRVQEIFINEFLQSEIKRISELMNFKSYPEAKFVRVNLDDPTQTMRIIAQLMQIGILTAKDGNEAMETGELPDWETLVQNQKDYKILKDQGLFQPVIGGVADQLKVLDATGEQQVALQDEQQKHQTKMTDKQNKHDVANPPAPVPPAIHINAPSMKVAQPTGRPPGTKAPQTTKKISPIGTGKGTEEKFSMSKLIEGVKLMEKIKDQFTNEYKKYKKITKLQDAHKELIGKLTKTLFENENINEWENKIQTYIENPVPPNLDKVLELESIAAEYEISNDAAILLYNSRF